MKSLIKAKHSWILEFEVAFNHLSFETLTVEAAEFVLVSLHWFSYFHSV